MTRPGIEPRSPGSLENTLTITSMTGTFGIKNEHYTIFNYMTVNLMPKYIEIRDDNEKKEESD